MEDMNTSSVTQMSDRQQRGRRVRRAIEARRGLVTATDIRESRSRPRGGRAWINGFELGGTDTRHLPLAVQFD
jgi:hypothetical protein